MLAVKKLFSLFVATVFVFGPSMALAVPAAATDFTSTISGGAWSDNVTWIGASAPSDPAHNVTIEGPVTIDQDYEVGNFDISTATSSLEYVGASSTGVLTFTGLFTSGGLMSDIEIVARGDIDASGQNLTAEKLTFDTSGVVTVTGTISAPVVLAQDLALDSTGMIFDESIFSDGHSIILNNANPVLTIEDVLDNFVIRSAASGELIITKEISADISYIESGNINTVTLDGATISSDTQIGADTINIENSLFVGANLYLDAEENITASGSVNGTGDVYFNSDMEVTGSWNPANTYFFWNEDSLAVSYQYQYATSIGDVYTNPTATTTVSTNESENLTALVGPGKSVYIWYRPVFADNSVGDWSEFISVNKEPNNAPVIETDGQTGANVSVSIVEGTTFVAIASSTDPDGNDIESFLLSGGADAEKFQTQSASNTLAIELTSEPDFEIPGDDDQDNIYEIILSSRDSLGEVGIQEVLVTVRDSTNEPVFINSEDGSIEEGSGDAFEITVTEPDNQDVAFSFDPGSPDAALLDLTTTSTSTAEISFIGGGDYDAEADDDGDNTYLVTIIAEDIDGNQAFQNLEIELEDVNESAPIFTNPNGSAIYQIPSTETEVIVLEATDEDIDNDLEFAVSTSTDAGLFEIINDDTLTFKTTAATGTYNVSVSVSDGDFVTVQGIVIEVLDGSINYAPEFGVPIVATSTTLIEVSNSATSSMVELDENNATSTKIATLEATDFNNDNLEFSIASSTLDGDLFTVGTTTGEVVTLVSFDFEDTDDDNQDNIYEVDFIVSDGDLEDVFTLFLEVLNISDIDPVNTSATSTSVQEGEATVLTLTAVDGDNDDVFWSVSGTDSQFFAVASTTGELTFATTTVFASPVDNDADNVYELETIVTDQSGATSSADLLVTVTEAPVVVAASSGGGGGSSSRRVCRDPEAINYQTFGTSDPDRCEYEEEGTEESAQEDVTPEPVVVVVTNTDEATSIVAPVSANNDSAEEVAAATSIDNGNENVIEEDSTELENEIVENVDEENQVPTQAASLINVVDDYDPWWPPFAAATIAVIGFYIYRRNPVK